MAKHSTPSEIRCACKHRDARLCYEIRYNIDDDDHREVCECLCHDDPDEEDR